MRRGILASLDARPYELRQYGRCGHRLPLVRGVLNRVDDVLVAGAAAESCRQCRRGSAGSDGFGLSFSRLTADMIMPGVQKPHWRPCSSQKPSCSGCSWPSLASPSMVVTSEPSACTANIVQDFDAAAVEQHRAGAALAGVAADVGAGQIQLFAKEVDEQCARLDLSLPGSAVDLHGNLDHASLVSACAPVMSRDHYAGQTSLFCENKSSRQYSPLVRKSIGGDSTRDWGLGLGPRNGGRLRLALSERTLPSESKGIRFAARIAASSPIADR